MSDPSSVQSIMVVALAPDLRDSLVFLLTAEGYAVESSPTWPPPRLPAPETIVVIDESSLARPNRSDAGLAARLNRVIVLTSRNELARRFPAARAIGKPLLDRALLDALQAACTEDVLGEAAPSGKRFRHSVPRDTVRRYT